ncbi:MAG: hypothetical protein DRQ39_04370 [Gammaproteobacteria bacterium]|nr:MAG: hypothetical protein DRQ39_04370 [Gammaproteobacteria bacterium]
MNGSHRLSQQLAAAAKLWRLLQCDEGRGASLFRCWEGSLRGDPVPPDTAPPSMSAAGRERSERYAGLLDCKEPEGGRGGGRSSPPRHERRRDCRYGVFGVRPSQRCGTDGVAPGDTYEQHRIGAARTAQA